jgi:DNA-binding winged helix-turn-helix (wHTH) protein
MSQEQASAAAARAALAAAGIELDLERGQLRCADGHRAVLRRQSMAVLVELARHAGRVVSRGQLFAAVWPGRCVTEDSLVQCVLEIRRALGADACAVVRTLPRRGYVLDLLPALAEAPKATVWAAAPASLAAELVWLVQRDLSSMGETFAEALRTAAALHGCTAVTINCLEVVQRPLTEGLAIVITGEIRLSQGAVPFSLPKASSREARAA